MGNNQQPTSQPPVLKDGALPSVSTPSSACYERTLMQEYFPNNCKLIRVCDHDEENRRKQEENLKNYREKYLSRCNGILEKMLPEEIIVEILYYLPMKSLIKLQMVSKNFRLYWTELPGLWDKFSDYPKMMYIPMVYESMRSNFGYYNEFRQKLINLHEKPTRNFDFTGYQYKAIVLGDKKCGKTILHNRVFKGEPFSQEYVYTIGVDFSTTISKQNIYIQSWDTGGDERFRTININFFRGMKGHFYCFDLNNHESFEVMKDIFQDWKNVYLKGEDLSSYFTKISFALVGLKSDLERKVSRDEIHEFLENIEPLKDKTLHTSRVQYFELSSKEDSISDLLFPFVYSYHNVMEIPRQYSTSISEM
ncbi:rab family small GTPase [Naegleria gruberi]|uniref:Rab family small GTPase n=1 Tax=Naegleria gruberi TaxID=5762 RepID=D2VT17_NAEGR|nr:rab family small GTPase [Naegleria gruberi]EFC40006.1 rab family small GTPase [Naegleria gruberi]|eukprot:XP_002672750.1 rab family small GTPase [Naegleria gruberi strain NEG-M]